MIGAVIWGKRDEVVGEAMMDGAGRTVERVRGVPRQVDEAARRLRRGMTAAERVLWESLRDRKVDGLKFRRQYAVGPFVLDFCCSSHRLVVEVDGAVHEDDEQSAHDKLRTEHLAAFGYHVLRFRNEDVLSAHRTVLDAIRTAARAREGPHPRPLSQSWERGA